MSLKIAKFPPNRRSQPYRDETKQNDLFVEAEVNRDGVGMGVLSDGTPYLNQRAIGDLCGLRNKYIGLISADWDSDKPTKEVVRVKELLFEATGNIPSEPHIEVWQGRKRHLAYPDTVCLAILEYFAFEAERAGADLALRNYRKLAGHGLKRLIYAQTGYVQREVEDVWKIFRDRVSLTFDSVPAGYFGVFQELAPMIVSLGEAGLHIDEAFVPDISVGRAWSTHWEKCGLSAKYGNRATYPHNFPSYFPQAASNPQLARCYPEDALGEFRRWFRQDYIGDGKFRNYISQKAAQKKLPNNYVERAVIALTKGD